MRLPAFLSRISRRRRELLGMLGNTPRLIQLVWAAAPGWLSVNILLTLINSSVPVAQLYISKLIVDQVILILAHEATGFTPYLLGLVLLGLGLLLINEVLNQLAVYVKRVLEDQFLLYANVRLLQQAMRLDLAHYESAEFHDILNLAQQSGGQYPLRVVSLLSRLLGQFTRLGGLLALLLRFNLGVMGLLLMSVLPTFWIGIRYSSRRFRMNRRQTPSRRLADYFYQILTDPQYVK
ncbi:MAG: ABC transporter ATP-binding protein, partial [Moorea sp. SIO3C2]|nr:ABC transporter ATP-binding protein [Moorena sp. SIO3C2]